jgi:hypothetical protein
LLLMKLQLTLRQPLQVQDQISGIRSRRVNLIIFHAKKLSWLVFWVSRWTWSSPFICWKIIII